MEIIKSLFAVGLVRNINICQTRASASCVSAGALYLLPQVEHIRGQAKGENFGRRCSFARVMRRRARRIRTEHEGVLDTCGTGGDGAGTFNVSTVVAFVVAAAGVPVAKHGNRSVSSRCGSADLLEGLGIRIDGPPDEAEISLQEAGFGFLYENSMRLTKEGTLIEAWFVQGSAEDAAGRTEWTRK